MRSISPAFRAALLISIALALPGLTVPEARANNGEIAFAFPISEMKVDGELGEWNGEHRRYPIARHGGDEEPASADLDAEFRVAFDASAGMLYLAVEVRDDLHRPHGGEGEPVWNEQDSHLLYVDRQHLPSGSGGVLYQAGDGLREIVAPMEAWDPGSAGASWDGVEVAIRRHGGRTVYEWGLRLGDAVRPYRSLGLDHLLADQDTPEEEAQLVLWGPGFGKSTQTFRLGDVVLLPLDAALGRLEGQVRWKREIDRPPLGRVRLTSLTHPELWVQAAVGEDGGYSLELPAGEYRISSPYRLTQPFAAGEKAPLRIDGTVTAAGKVPAGGTATAEPLVLPTFDPPSYLYRREGWLADFDERRMPEVDAFVEAFRRYYAVPGVSVALVRDGELAYHRTFGVGNRRTGKALEPTTVFEAASITKPVFAFAVMRLVERGVLELDAPLHRYLGFPNIAGDPRSRKMTARHVLSHRSGLPNWAWGGPGTWRTGGSIELGFEPGTDYGYSGEGFNYLGRVLEELTGEDLEQLLHEEVVRPMGLVHTRFYLTEEQAREASIGHWHEYPSWKRRAGEISVASSMHTEARDLMRFAIGLIEGVDLTSETYAEMLRPHLSLDEEQRSTEEEQHVGLGFFLRDTPFGKLVEHGGNNGDFRCKLGVIPEAGLAYGIFTNNNTGHHLAEAVERFLLEGRGKAD
ncbi:MAG: serine hydrolase [Holophagales bacterium]|nr:serine hydrolase [Holophagales bacterium]